MPDETIAFKKESTLIAEAAISQNLKLRANPRELCSNPEFDSGSAGTFLLNDGFLATLKKYGFTFEPGKTPSHSEMVYLSGNSHQPNRQEIWDSDCWAWKRSEVGPRELTVSFRLSVSEEHRGVVFLPKVWGNCSGGACHQPTIEKCVAAIAEHFPNAHPLIKAVKDAGPHPVINWSDIGLGGIKSVGKLFHELFGHNETVYNLADTRLSPFNPPPHPKRIGMEMVDRLFVLEADQTKLFKQWKDQLQEFCASLEK